MNFDFSAPSIFLFVSATLCLWLSIHALRRQTTSFTRNYAGLMLCAAAYALGYGLELGSPDLIHVQVMLRIQYLGIPFLPYFWISLAWAYLEPQGMPLRWKYLPLCLSVAIFLVFQTNDLHHLYYTSQEFTRSNGLSITRIGKGSVYWLNIAYLNISIAIGALLLFRAWRQAIPLYRQQALMLLAGSFLPWIFHLLYQTGLSPHQIDLSPFGIAATGIIYSLATLNHKMLSVLPLARDIVFDGIAEGVIVLDSNLRIIDFNYAATRFYPKLTLSMIGAEAATLVNPAAFADPLPSAQAFIDSTDGRKLEIRCYPLRNKHGPQLGTALLIQDVSKKLALIDGLRELATIDELTGCCNRRRLIELSEREVLRATRHHQPLAFIILDVDDFKTINDTLGHLAGDDLLRRIAFTLRGRLRSTDILGRYGGDEFIITLPETTGSAAALIAQELLEHCFEHCDSRMSIGVVELTSENNSFTELLRQADFALYQSKLDGKNRVTLYRPTQELVDIRTMLR